MKVQITDISNWNVKEWLSTTGTREKCIVENSNDGKIFFFKESIDKFPSEFWSEIIASKVGEVLGFEMLDYNIAIYKEKIGCICQYMINPDNQELIHGISLIKKVVKGFAITARPGISFQQVEKALQPYRDFIYKFIDILIFDSLIGNQDRHSENWAVIRSLDTKFLKHNENAEKKYFADMYRRYFLNIKGFMPFRSYFQKQLDERALFDYQFSPIYDSGSSLGREILEERIPDFICKENKIKKYLENGISEIQWNTKKVNHFLLIEKVGGSYKEYTKKRVSEVLAKYSANLVKEIIHQIDVEVPEKFAQNKLSLQRKELIHKLIDSRINHLKKAFAL